LAGGTSTAPAWVCGDCRHDKAKIDAQAARGKLFTLALDLEDMNRYQLAHKLGEGSGLAVGQECRPLLRIVAALKARDWTGIIDVDLEDVTEQHELEAAEAVMRNARDGLYGKAAEAADKLRSALVNFRWAGEPPKPQPRNRLTDAELSALQHGEKPISAKDS
jgi:hypothetical protein